MSSLRGKRQKTSSGASTAAANGETLFELLDRDLAGRIGRLKTAHGEIETPAILPVINPNRHLIEPSEMKKFGAQAIITNSYILWKDYQERVLAEGVHGLMGFQGPIMTDSGAFQLMEYGDIDVTNEQIIKFQERIGVDIGVMLDIPTASDNKPEVKRNVEETIKRAKEIKPLISDSEVLWCGPIQGGTHMDLLRKCGKAMAALPFSVHPVGSIVPLMMSYRYADVIHILREAQKVLPSNRPIHAFGAGHPMFFAMCAAVGVDLFDSAAYALFAKDGRYMTNAGTDMLDELKYLPCSCPVCSKHTAKELDESPQRERLLAEHNLYVSFQELNTVKQAIRDKTLWDLLEMRCRSHPRMLAAMNEFVRDKAFLDARNPVSKHRMFYFGDYTEDRPSFRRRVEAAQAVKKMKWEETRVPVYGMLPKAVLDCYPFSQTVYPDEDVPLKRERDQEKKVRGASIYWFGVDVFPEKIVIKRSQKTNRIRAVYDEKGVMLAALRANDFMLLLHDAARVLHKKSKKNRVVLKDADAKKYALQGGSVFAKFVEKASPGIIPLQQVLVVDERDRLLACGETLLNSKELIDFDYGVAVRLRWTNQTP